MMGFEKKFICLPNKSIVLSSLNKKCSDGHIQHCQTGLVKYCRCRELIQFKWEWKVSWCAWVNNSTSLSQRIDRQDRVCWQFRGYKLPTNILKQVWEKTVDFFNFFFVYDKPVCSSINIKDIFSQIGIVCCAKIYSCMLPHKVLLLWPGVFHMICQETVKLSQLERPSYVNS